MTDFKNKTLPKANKITDLFTGSKAQCLLAPLNNDLKFLVALENYDYIIKKYLFNPHTEYDVRVNLERVGLKFKMSKEEIADYFNN